MCPFIDVSTLHSLGLSLKNSSHAIHALTTHFGCIKHKQEDCDTTSVGPESKVDVDIDGKKVTVIVGELQRDEEYNPTQTHYLRSGDGFIVPYSVSSREQFNAIPEWKNKILAAKETDKVPIVIVGTYRDKDENMRVVTVEEGKEMAERLNCGFFDVNSTRFDEVNAAFIALARMILQERSEKNKKKGKESKEHDCVLM